ncbi:hypothetical protein ALC62_12776 [Cyphomyrmex costatus]|uniref:Uncharacterized protein n=1 Tax=Cyphomyrmex costatus TaxID=456900 RepID=A0A151IAN7_9HYME|nr:hypothetical protein ALC62_12776 [Cyphomyrmex costatus]
MYVDQQKLLQHKISRCVSTMIKPLRIFQLFAVLLLFTVTIYMIVMDPMPINAFVCILLIVLSGVYIFVLAIELISHYAGSALHIIPMAVFSLLGLLLFTIAGLSLIFKAYTQLIVIIAITLCLLAALFFLIDITMVLAFWKRKCSICRQCCSNMTELVPHKVKEPSVLGTQMRRDVTTSLSDIRVPCDLQGVATPDHSYRKVEYARRREYVDSPTCVPSLCNLDVAQIQTESRKMSVVESQTPRAVTKETPMQTLSKCEFCSQHIQLPLTLPITERAGAPSTYCFQHPQWSYPAVMHFVRGGVSMPCCPGCKCGAGTAQIQQQSQQLKQQRRSLSKVKSSPDKTTSEMIQQVTNIESGTNVTKMTAQPTSTCITSIYGPDKRMQTTPDIDYKRKVAAEIKEDIRDDIDQKIAEKTKIKLAKTKGFDTIKKTLVKQETLKQINKDSIEENEKIIGENKIERSKGGGEHCIRIYQEFMGAEFMKQESITNLEESLMNTSKMLSTPLSSRKKSRTLLHLKSNKVDPITDANVCIINEDFISERMTRTILDNQNIEESLTPTSDNSRCYIVFRDKKGRYFCEFCAPLDSKKVNGQFLLRIN